MKTTVHFNTSGFFKQTKQKEVTNLQRPTAIKGSEELLVMCPCGKFYQLKQW